MTAKTASKPKIPTSFICLLIACIVEIVIGVLLLINPVGFTGAIVTVAGLALIAWGVYCIVKYFRTSPAEASQRQELAKGLGAVLLGGIFCFQFNWIAAATPLLGGAYGLVILGCGVFKTQRAVDLLRLKRRFWYLAGIGALLALVAGFVILANPFTSNLLWVFTAVALLVTGAIDLVALLLSGREQPVKTKIVLGGEGDEKTPAATPAPQPAPAAEPAVAAETPGAPGPQA